MSLAFVRGIHRWPVIHCSKYLREEVRFFIPHWRRLIQLLLLKFCLHNCFKTFVKITKLTLCTQRRKIITVPLNISSSVYQNVPQLNCDWTVGSIISISYKIYSRLHPKWCSCLLGHWTITKYEFRTVNHSKRNNIMHDIRISSKIAIDKHNVKLTHWGRNKMAAISQTTLSNAFSCMKMLECLLDILG